MGFNIKLEMDKRQKKQFNDTINIDCGTWSIYSMDNVITIR